MPGSTASSGSSPTRDAARCTGRRTGRTEAGPERLDGPYVGAPGRRGLRRPGRRRRGRALPRRVPRPRASPQHPRGRRPGRAGSPPGCRRRHRTRSTCAGRTPPSPAPRKSVLPGRAVTVRPCGRCAGGTSSGRTCPGARAVPRPVVGRDVLVRARTRAGDAALPGGRDAAASSSATPGWSRRAAGRRADPRRRAGRQGQGLGPAAPRRAARRGRGGAEAGEVLLEVRADNAPAQALYAAAGFERIGVRRGYYRRAAPTPWSCGCASVGSRCRLADAARIATRHRRRVPRPRRRRPDACSAALADSRAHRRAGRVDRPGRRLVGVRPGRRALHAGTTTSGTPSSSLGRSGGRRHDAGQLAPTSSPGTPTRPTCARCRAPGCPSCRPTGSSPATSSSCPRSGSTS